MITMKDIAQELGISPTTVSNVLHGRTKEVSKATIARVRKKVEELNYIPNMSARNLACSTSKIIGLIIRYPKKDDKNAMQDPFCNEIIGTVEQEVRKAEYFLMIYASDDADEIVSIASHWNAAGIIALGLNDSVCQKLVTDCVKPVVFIDSHFLADDKAYINVGLKDREGAYIMGKYLLSQGHRKIAFMADNLIGVDHERWMGFHKSTVEYGLPNGNCPFIRIGMGYEGMEATCEEIYRRKEEFTALFFASDYYASFAANWLQDKGVRIPEELSVVGFDDNIFARMSRPKLTTVRQSPSKKAQLAVLKLLDRIHGMPITEKNTQLDVILVIRDSVRNLNASSN